MSIKSVKLIWVGIAISILPILVDIWNLHYFTQVYKLHVTDSKVEIPFEFRWGTYKPWLLVALSEAVVESDRHSFSFLYHNASDKVDGVRYNTRDRQNGNFEYDTLIHDPSNITIQSIYDEDYQIVLNSTFLVNSSQNRQEWLGILEPYSYPSMDSSSDILSMILMFKIEALDVELSETWLNVSAMNCIQNEASNLPCDESFTPNITIQIMNNSNSVNKFNGYVVQASENVELRFSYVNTVSKKKVWDSKGYALDKLSESKGIWTLDSAVPDVNQRKNTTMIVVQALAQMDKLNGSYVRIAYYQKENSNLTIENMEKYASDQFDSAPSKIVSKSEIFRQIFGKFYLNDTEKIKNDSQALDVSLSDCSLRSFSMLQAGLSLFWGNITSKNYTSFSQKLEARLLTMVPSRDKLYRGYFWDEGFHQLVNVWMYHNISLLSLKTWFNLLDERGWIAREQIRGVEARAFFEGPEIDMIMYTNTSNPMTLSIVMSVLTSFPNLTESDKASLVDIWSKMLRYYNFFSVSQEANLKANPFSQEKYVYKWTFYNNASDPYGGGSGLDDYPRAGPQGTDFPTYNLDLHCWMMFFAQTMEYTADKLINNNGTKNLDTYKNYQLVFHILYLNLTENLEMYFFDKETNLYKEPINLAHSSFSEHLGYVNLFPFLFHFGKLNDSSAVGDAVRKSYYNLLTNADLLWSEYGIRSLSKNDTEFDVEKYWRGNVWINFNYLVLRAIWLYYKEDPNYLELYDDLRNNVLKNVCGHLGNRGSLWENYDSLNGEPKQGHPYAGSSSLIVLIIAEKYDF